MSAKRAACQAFAGYPAAGEAPWPPSFQPRNAVTRMGCRRSGLSAMRSSSGTTPVYARLRATGSAQEGGQHDGPGPDCGRRRHVDEHEPPGQVRPVLELADPHLDEHEPHEPDREPEEERRGPSLRREVADDEDEREAEDRDTGRVHGQERVEPTEAGDAVATRVWPRGGRERAGDDEG